VKFADSGTFTFKGAQT